MYPSIPSTSTNYAPLSSARTSSSGGGSYPTIGQGARPAWPQPSRPPPPLSNGPTAEPDQNHPTVFVQIAEPFRTSPPVMIGGGLDAVPRSQFEYDFSFEKKLLLKQKHSHLNPVALLNRVPSRTP
eukprot:jgi/Botrbrau1/1702/Bobra.116_2s0044.1